MKVVDLNLLLYAINRDSPHHDKARSWWEDSLSRDEPIGMAWVVILGFLRLTTRPGLFPSPLRIEDALSVMDGWLTHPTVVTLHPGARHWKVLKELLVETGAGGNLTTDAHLAALTIECDATLVTTDRDFSRFAPPLRHVNPLL